MKCKISYTPAIIKLKVLEAPTMAKAPKLWRHLDAVMESQCCRRILMDCRGIAPKVDSSEAQVRADSARKEAGILKLARLAIVYDEYVPVVAAFTDRLSAAGVNVEAFTSADAAISWLSGRGDQFVDWAQQDTLSTAAE